MIAASLVLAVLGLWAAWLTPVDAIPDLSENQVIVFADWKGHGPREVENQLTYPLALGLQGLRGVRVVRSSSDVGFATISVIFDDGVEFQEGRRRVAERLARIGGDLPAGVSPRLAPDSLATGQIFWYTVEGAGLDLGRLRSIQDWYVKPQLSSVAGVAEVSSVGGYPLEYQVAIDPRKLQAVGITLGEVLDAVAASNSAAGGHVVVKAKAEYVVRGVGWLGASRRAGDESFDSQQALLDLENIPLAGRSSRPDSPCRCGQGVDLAWHPARSPGEGRQRGRRRRGPDGAWREPARGDAPAQIKNQGADARSARRREDHSLLRSNAPDRRGDRHGHRHGGRGDDLGQPVRPGRPAASPHVVHRGDHPAPCRALVVLDHGDFAAGGNRRHPGQRDVAGGNRDLDRRAGRFVDRHGRERDASAQRAIRRSARAAAT